MQTLWSVINRPKASSLSSTSGLASRSSGNDAYLCAVANGAAELGLCEEEAVSEGGHVRPQGHG